MTPPAEKPKRGLGRGLDALFADAEARIETDAPIENVIENKPGETSGVTPVIQSGARQLPIAILIPGPFQPRRKFDDTELKALAESIRVHGVLQPLLVRVSGSHPGKFEIIAGERRWRASQLAQQHEVPVIIRDFNDRAALEIGLIENIQRQDLTPIEEAEGYQRLIHEFKHTQEALAEIVGKSRAHLANTMRLLSLPEAVRHQVHDGLLSAGHARQLIGLDNATELADEIIKQKWSVRDTEHEVAKLKHPGAASRAKAPSTNPARPAINAVISKDADVLALENEMSSLLGLKTEIESQQHGNGIVQIYFSSLDQLDDLLQKLTKSAKV